jgi:uncharacterized membrane protein YkoI
MATEKVFLPIIVLIFFGFTVKGDYGRNKYTQTSYNFPDTNIVKLTGIKEAIDNVMQLTEGDVTKAERKFSKDIPVWKVDVITNDRGIIKVELSALDNSLVRIDSDEGPFDYEIKPQKDLISFGEAKKTAEGYTGQKTLKWNFYKNRDQHEYNFWLFIKSGKAQVRVNAETGEIVTTKKKK